MIAPMRYSHVALYADDLRGAEEFYAQVFAAEVLFREAVGRDGVWHTLRREASWEDAEEAGIELQMVALRRDEIVLPVFAGRPAPRIIGLDASAEEIEGMRRRLPDAADVLTHSGRQLVFTDPFGVEWQVRADTDFRSQGEMHGRWLVVSGTRPDR